MRSAAVKASALYRPRVRNVALRPSGFYAEAPECWDGNGGVPFLLSNGKTASLRRDRLVVGGERLALVVSDGRECVLGYGLAWRVAVPDLADPWAYYRIFDDAGGAAASLGETLFFNNELRRFVVGKDVLVVGQVEVALGERGTGLWESLFHGLVAQRTNETLLVHASPLRYAMGSDGKKENPPEFPAYMGKFHAHYGKMTENARTFSAFDGDIRSWFVPAAPSPAAAETSSQKEDGSSSHLSEQGVAPF